jgi:hypothetical protein
MTLKNLEAALQVCSLPAGSYKGEVIHGAAALKDIAELKARSEAEVRHVQRSFLSVEAELTAERARHKACAKLAEEDLSATNWEASYDKVCRERDEQKAVLAEATQLREPSAERVHTSRNHCIIIAELDCLRVEVARLHVLVDDETDARVRVEYELSAERARHAETMRESNDLHDELRALKDPARKAPGRPTVDELANAVCALQAANDKHKAMSDEFRATLEELAEAKRQLAIVATDWSGVWKWQGDTNDDPATLACPVVMSADKLLEVLADRKAGGR